MSQFLEGRRILIVEDEYLTALDFKLMIEQLGGTVIGPVGRLDQAVELARIHEPDGAILDVRLDNSTSFPLADELIGKEVPIIFATGYDTPMLPDRFSTLPRLPKPITAAVVERALRQAFRLPG